MIKRYPFHIFLFAFFPLLFFYAHNIREVRPLVLVTPLGGLSLAVFILYISSRLLFKDRLKSGVAVSFFWILFFSYGHIFSYFKNVKIDGFKLGCHEYFIILWILFFAGGLYLIHTQKRDFSNFTFSLNVVSIFLVSLSLIRIVYFEFKRIPGYRYKKKISFRSSLEKKDTYPFKPDIYYLIFDRYPSQQTLKKLFNFDNSKFITYLKKKGFFIASQSKANYPKTFLSLASSLNMQYLDDIAQNLGEDFQDETPIYKMLEDYKVWRFLKERGYMFIHFGDWWEPTRRNRFADKNFNYNPLGFNEFTTKFLKTTFILAIWDLRLHLEYQARKERILYKFKKLSEIPYIKGPKFIFAHMIIPHRPHIFDKDGNLLKISEIDSMDEKDKYTGELLFLNKKIKELVEALLARSSQPPVIIIQSDEGPFTYKDFGNNEGWSTDWRNLTLEAIKTHMEILNALYLPDFNTSRLYSSLSPVNTFRLIFNHYFGADFKLLEDRSFIFKDPYHPYSFIEVTDKLANLKD